MGRDGLLSALKCDYPGEMISVGLRICQFLARREQVLSLGLVRRPQATEAVSAYGNSPHKHVWRAQIVALSAMGSREGKPAADRRRQAGDLALAAAHHGRSVGGVLDDALRPGDDSRGRRSSNA
jgi:hypothetical protein